MKVILLKDVAKVGQHGTVKDVSDGYALNFLIARGLAIQATPEKIAAYEATQKKEKELREREEAALATAIRSLEGARIEFAVRATEKGGLFKAITTSDIVRELAQQKAIKIPVDTVVLAKPLKEVGDHAVHIQAVNAKANITVVVKAVGK